MIPQSSTSSSVDSPCMEPETIYPMQSTKAYLDTQGIKDVEKQKLESESDSPPMSRQVPLQEVLEDTYDFYFRNLANMGFGTPLWIPEPSKDLPIKYRKNGFAIGDIGIVCGRGWFDSLFNICLPKDDPLQVAINSKHLPVDYSPLEIKPGSISHYRNFNQGAYVSSKSVQGTLNALSGLTFKSSLSEGAILTFPDGSKSEDLRNKKSLQDYLAVYGEEIYRCALDVHGRDLRNSDLRVVTGLDKTIKWGMAAFKNSRFETKPWFCLEFGPGGKESRSWESTGRTEVKTGPSTRQLVALRMEDSSQQDVEYANQTVFLRTETLSLKSRIWNALVSECGIGILEPESDNLGVENDTCPDSLGIGGESSTLNSFFDSRTNNNFETHPSSAINAMLLKLNQSARMAITGDDIWTSVLKDDDAVLPSFETLWSRIMKSYDVRLENDVVFLVKLESEIC